MGTSDSKQGGFTVTDRRSFAGGEPPKNEDAAPAPASGAEVEAPAGRARDASSLPAVDFHTFVLSLGSSALLHMGELDSPDGNAGEIDLPMAKHTIDVIAMLQEKTKGNLTEEEARFLDNLLLDLRLRYVTRTSGKAE